MSGMYVTPMHYGKKILPSGQPSSRHRRTNLIPFSLDKCTCLIFNTAATRPPPLGRRAAAALYRPGQPHGYGGTRIHLPAQARRGRRRGGGAGTKAAVFLPSQGRRIGCFCWCPAGPPTPLRPLGLLLSRGAAVFSRPVCRWLVLVVRTVLPWDARRRRLPRPRNAGHLRVLLLFLYYLQGPPF